MARRPLVRLDPGAVARHQDHPPGRDLIAGLASRVRARPRRDARFRTEKQGAFDLRATAFSYGITVAELERRLSARRRQTALTAYGLAGLGLLFFGVWLIQVLAAEDSGAVAADD